MYLFIVNCIRTSWTSLCVSLIQSIGDKSTTYYNSKSAVKSIECADTLLSIGWILSFSRLSWATWASRSASALRCYTFTWLRNIIWLFIICSPNWCSRALILYGCCSMRFSLWIKGDFCCLLTGDSWRLRVGYFWYGTDVSIAGFWIGFFLRDYWRCTLISDPGADRRCWFGTLSDGDSNYGVDILFWWWDFEVESSPTRHTT